MMINDMRGMVKTNSRRLFSLFALGAVMSLSACDEEDPRATELRSDMSKLSGEEVSGIVELSAYVRECLKIGQISQPDGSVKELGAVNVFSRENGSKLLLLVEYPDVKEITPETQPVLFGWVEDCAQEFIGVENDFYMAWTTGVITSFVKTPDTENENITKDDSALYAFYDGLKLE